MNLYVVLFVLLDVEKPKEYDIMTRYSHGYQKGKDERQLVCKEARLLKTSFSEQLVKLHDLINRIQSPIIKELHIFLYTTVID